MEMNAKQIEWRALLSEMTKAYTVTVPHIWDHFLVTFESGDEVQYEELSDGLLSVAVHVVGVTKTGRSVVLKVR